MEIREHSKEGFRIVIFMVVPDDIQEGKHNVESIKDVESNQKIVETNLLLKMSSFKFHRQHFLKLLEPS